jgi:hypothetical protein
MAPAAVSLERALVWLPDKELFRPDEIKDLLQLIYWREYVFGSSARIQPYTVSTLMHGQDTRIFLGV